MSRSWIWFVAIAAMLGVLTWSTAVGNERVGTFAYWSGMGIVAVLVAWRVARALVRRGESAREVVAPGMQGLDEVQGLYLGRPDVGPVSYGTEDRPVPGLVVDRPDPLDDKVWRV